MELRHLRYFIAVAEEGSFTLAAERRLHTSQPSLSRQIRDLEHEVRTPLLIRSARGVELTAAGHAFLDHARIALAQVEAGGEAARRAAFPAGKPRFALGFLTGEEMDWLPSAMRVLRDELPRIEVTVSSDSSPRLADALMRGKLDLAFLRSEADLPDLAFTTLVSEPLVVVLRSDHPLAAQTTIAPAQLTDQTFINVAPNAPTLRPVIDGYLARHAPDVTTAHEVDNLAMALSLVSSTRGVALLPIYARNFLPASMVSRPLAGIAPTIDLVLGHRHDNHSPLLALFLSKVDALIAGVVKADKHALTRRSRWDATRIVTAGDE